ncbi:hypothetical protein BD779DRAFT_912988 [Infundibulicybe gibba]|nr:hypothetical protein BD779DRAFT_912988 [Infundibulicybe gibba]
MRLSDPNGASDQFLNSLWAPHLEVIQIDDIYHSSPVPSALIACVARSHCTELTSLELLCSRISADELLQLSSLTPGLRELDMRLTPDAFWALMPPSIGNKIFPRLARLTVRDVMVPDQELISVCRSRFSPSPNSIEGEPQAEPLQYCRIYLHDELEVARRLQDVAESFQDDTGFRKTMRRVKRLLSNTVRTSPNIPLEVSPENVHHLENCFDFLEKHKINHALLLERHNSEHILGQISMESPGNNAVPPHLRMRASALLAKWKPLMEEYTARDARWVLEPSSYNVYRLVYHPTIKPKGHFASKFLGPLIGEEYQY